MTRFTRRAGRLAIAALAVVTGVAGCVDLLGPGRTARPTLASLSLDDYFTNLRDSGLMYVDAVPGDAGFRLKPSQRVPIEITVSSGDREQAGLYRQFCPFTDRGEHFYCFQFVIFMCCGPYPEHVVTTLADRVAAIGGRFDLVSATGWIGGVTLFSPDDVVKHARDAASWPGVEYTELAWPNCVTESGGGGSCPSVAPFLAVPLPVDTGRAIPGDGIVQVRSGDTVVATYYQPSGAVLQARAVVP
ncbi:MAG: hypothetical protein ABSG61_07880 [Gemmatimonadales bacterium]